MTGLPGYPCPVCGAPGGAVSITFEGRPPEQVCSNKCGALFVKLGGEVHMNPIVEKSVKHAGDVGGSYLDSIGKTDLATLTREEWFAFCKIIYLGTCEEMRRLADDEIPF